jgi:hypothetical protein
MRDEFDLAGRTDEMGRDMELADVLKRLAPEHADPNYWMRFREWVVSEAAGELARRRLVAHLTVSDVMSSWARALLPTAALAAALAGIILMRGPEDHLQQMVSVEELLVSDLEGETIPATLGPDTSGPAITFASEIF